MLGFLINPVTGDSGINPVVIVAAIVAELLVVFLLVWPKLSKKDKDDVNSDAVLAENEDSCEINRQKNPENQSENGDGSGE